MGLDLRMTRQGGECSASPTSRRSPRRPDRRRASPATTLSPAELNTAEAFIDRLVPKDENGSGEMECGAAYIDRALAGALAADKGTFLEGLTAVDALARSTHSAAFADLTPRSATSCWLRSTTARRPVSPTRVRSSTEGAA